MLLKTIMFRLKYPQAESQMDSHNSRCVLCCWIHMTHFVFVLLHSHDSRCVLCCLIHMIHVVLCDVGFPCFTVCFVLYDSHDSRCVLGFLIHTIRVIFCVVGFT